MYESKIRTALWMAYDLPGNIGWLLYFVGLGHGGLAVLQPEKFAKAVRYVTRERGR